MTEDSGTYLKEPPAIENWCPKRRIVFESQPEHIQSAIRRSEIRAAERDAILQLRGYTTTASRLRLHSIKRGISVRFLHGVAK
jgi:hypothetical protein